MMLEMEGAAKRFARERELVWWGAMMPHLEKPVSLEDFAGHPVDRAERARRFNAAWDKIDRSLARSKSIAVKG
jgi:hypothetical protein